MIRKLLFATVLLLAPIISAKAQSPSECNRVGFQGYWEEPPSVTFDGKECVKTYTCKLKSSGIPPKWHPDHCKLVVPDPVRKKGSCGTAKNPADCKITACSATPPVDHPCLWREQPK
jgi:hypothetical protein